jgi:hypothetical protein
MAKTMKSFVAFVSQEDVKESAIQQYMEEHTECIPIPDLLGHDLQWNAVFSQFEIDRDKIADFAYITKNTAEWRVVFIELERPQKKLFIEAPNVDFHMQTRRAIAQIESWKNYIEARPEEVRRRFSPLMQLGSAWDQNPVEYRYLLVIGRNPKGCFSSQESARISRLSRESAIRLLTYDSILRMQGRHGVGRRKNIFAHFRSTFRIKRAQADTNLFAHFLPHEIHLEQDQIAWFESRGYDMKAWLAGEYLQVNAKLPKRGLRDAVALMRAEEGSERLRHGEGAQAVRSGQLLLQVVGEPLLGCMRLTLRAMTMATRRIDVVVFPTALALREAVSRVSAAAILDGADDLTVHGGERGRTRKVFWRAGVEERAQGGHGRSPGMRALRRS